MLKCEHSRSQRTLLLLEAVPVVNDILLPISPKDSTHQLLIKHLSIIEVLNMPINREINTENNRMEII